MRQIEAALQLDVRRGGEAPFLYTVDGLHCPGNTEFSTFVCLFSDLMGQRPRMLRTTSRWVQYTAKFCLYHSATLLIVSTAAKTRQLPFRGSTPSTSVMRSVWAVVERNLCSPGPIEQRHGQPYESSWSVAKNQMYLNLIYDEYQVILTLSAYITISSEPSSASNDLQGLDPTVAPTLTFLRWQEVTGIFLTKTQRIVYSGVIYMWFPSVALFILTLTRQPLATAGRVRPCRSKDIASHWRLALGLAASNALGDLAAFFCTVQHDARKIWMLGMSVRGTNPFRVGS
jgi:hypothetical protein